MTAASFTDWAMAEPNCRYALAGGEVVAMVPERAGHAQATLNAVIALKRAVAAAGSSREAHTDGMSVVVDQPTVYERDGLLRSGRPLDREAAKVADPAVVVELLSPSAHAVDSEGKLNGYLRIASVRHYLIVKLATRNAIRDGRHDEGALRAALLTAGGMLHLDPPGYEFAVDDRSADL